MTSKELNNELYEEKISCMILESGSKGDLFVNFSTITPKKPNSPHVKLLEYDWPLDLKSLLIFPVLAIIHKSIL